jgi:hypothetical protein
MRSIGALAALLGGLCGQASAQIGPEYGVWRPTDARVKALFGDTWQNIGLGLGPVRVPDKKGGWVPDFQIIGARLGENRLTLIPIGYSWRRTFSGSSYFGVTPEVVVAQTQGPDLPSGWRTVGGLSVLVGQGFGEKFYLEGGYNAVGRVRTLNFSGWNLAAGFRF